MTPLERALLTFPKDLIQALVEFGAESAFIYIGDQPINKNNFYDVLERKIFKLTDEAWLETLETEVR